MAQARHIGLGQTLQTWLFRQGSALWQDRMTPAWERFGGGCHRNRKVDELIRAGFHIVDLRMCYLPGPAPSDIHAARTREAEARQPVERFWQVIETKEVPAVLVAVCGPSSIDMYGSLPYAAA